jgi:hypothetical protein
LGLGWKSSQWVLLNSVIENVLQMHYTFNLRQGGENVNGRKVTSKETSFTDLHAGLFFCCEKFWPECHLKAVFLIVECSTSH